MILAFSKLGLGMGRWGMQKIVAFEVQPYEAGVLRSLEPENEVVLISNRCELRMLSNSVTPRFYALLFTLSLTQRCCRTCRRCRHQIYRL